MIAKKVMVAVSCYLTLTTEISTLTQPWKVIGLLVAGLLNLQQHM